MVIVSWDRRGGVSLISNFILILSPALPTLDWSGRDNWGLVRTLYSFLNHFCLAVFEFSVGEESHMVMIFDLIKFTLLPTLEEFERCRKKRFNFNSGIL